MKTYLAFAVVLLFINLIYSAPAPELKKEFYNLDDAEELFKTFVKDYNKTYEGEEYQRRYNNFVENLKFINEHNASNSTFSVGLNKFADLGKDESPGKGLH
jgi:hypothetical protein